MVGVEQQEIPTDLVLRVREDPPFWRWAWLAADCTVVSEGVAFSEAGACKVAGTVLETLQMLAEQGDSPGPLAPGWEMTTLHLGR